MRADSAERECQYMNDAEEDEAERTVAHNAHAEPPCHLEDKVCWRVLALVACPE